MVPQLPLEIRFGRRIGEFYQGDLSRAGKPAGQIFFTLSVGTGSLVAYASYLKKKDDIVLSGLATAATNETAEVVLGGSLAIPAIVTFFGVTGAVAIAKGGTFDLGFVAMPLVTGLMNYVVPLQIGDLRTAQRQRAAGIADVDARAGWNASPDW